MKKIILVVVFFMVFSGFVYSFEFGIMAGKNSNPSITVYGISAGIDIFPLIKLEIETYRRKDNAYDALTAGIKLRKKLGPLAPYGILGVGTQYESFSLSFTDHDNFSFIGGGVHLFLKQIISFRLDYRYHNFKDFKRSHYSMGVFFHF